MVEDPISNENKIDAINFLITTLKEIRDGSDFELDFCLKHDIDQKYGFEGRAIFYQYNKTNLTINIDYILKLSPHLN